MGRPRELPIDPVSVEILDIVRDLPETSTVVPTDYDIEHYLRTGYASDSVLAMSRSHFIAQVAKRRYGYSNVELAKELGKGTSTIAAYANGSRTMQRGDIFYLYKMMSGGLDAFWLYTDGDSPTY